MKLPAFSHWKRPVIGLVAFGLGICLAAAQQAAPQNPKAAPQDPPKADAPPDPMEPVVPAADLEPPADAPPVMTFTKELITEDEAAALDTELNRKDKYKVLFRNAVLNNDTKPIIAKWAKWQLYRMTLKSNRRRLHEIRNDLMRDINDAGQRAAQKEMLQFRYLMCEEVTNRAAELLKNNFHVRLNAAIILAQLNLTEEDLKTPASREEQAYVKAALPLLDVINAPTGGGLDDQLEAVKIQAAIGIGRINLLGNGGDLNINIKNQNFRNVVAKDLIAQLENPSAHPWYQKRLVDALGSVDLVNDVSTGKPIILQALGEVLADRERHFRVRARAARALGRCPLPPGLNVQKLVFQILLLEHEMAVAYQKKPNEYYWLDCFEDVYFAFHPISEDEGLLYGNKRPPGLNQKNLGPVVQEAYQQVLPIASRVVNQPGWIPPKEGEKLAKNTKIPDQLIADLGQWLKDHQPADHKLAPSLPELDPAGPLPTASGGSTTATSGPAKQ